MNILIGHVALYVPSFFYEELKFYFQVLLDTLRHLTRKVLIPKDKIIGFLSWYINLGFHYYFSCLNLLSS